MKAKSIRLGAGSGYWGDAFDRAIELTQKGDLSYICFDMLGEPTIPPLQAEKKKDPLRGYVPTVTALATEILPIALEKGVKIVTNAGAINPEGAVQRFIKMANGKGIKGFKVGAVIGGGEEVLDTVRALRKKGYHFDNLDTGEGVEKIEDRITTGYVYIGSDSIVNALAQGADVIIAGRCADDSLYLGPLRYEFGWKDDDWDLLAAGVAIGHSIECGGMTSGGMTSRWRDSVDLDRLGYPIAEVYENGEAEISKLPGSGGIVDEITVTEHMLYEVEDPANYIMPEVVGDLTSLRLEQMGKDKVKVSGAKGKPRTDTLKLILAYPGGYIAEGMFGFPRPDALEKAQFTVDILKKRLSRNQFQAEETRVDFLGINSLHGPAAPRLKVEPNEVWVRFAARCKDYNEAIKLVREITSLITLSPASMANIFSPSRPREIYGLWPTLIPREEVTTKGIIMEA